MRRAIRGTISHLILVTIGGLTLGRFWLRAKSTFVEYGSNMTDDEAKALDFPLLVEFNFPGKGQKTKDGKPCLDCSVTILATGFMEYRGLGVLLRGTVVHSEPKTFMPVGFFSTRFTDMDAARVVGPTEEVVLKNQ